METKPREIGNLGILGLWNILDRVEWFQLLNRQHKALQGLI